MSDVAEKKDSKLERTICVLHFDASHCIWKQDLKKPKERQVQFCQHMRCPHGTVTETTVDGKLFLLVTCDLTWSAFDNRETTSEEREEMELLL